MAKKIILTAIAFVSSIFLLFVIIMHSADILQQRKEDFLSNDRTENTTETTTAETPDVNVTLPENTTTSEIIQQETIHHDSQEPNQLETENGSSIDPTVATEAPAQPTVPIEDLPQWKRLHIISATVNKAKYDHFALVNIDNDNIPELYMYGDGQSEICAVRGNATIAQRLNGVGGGNYHPQSGRFLNVYTENNYLVMRIYQLSNAFTQVFYGREDKTVQPAAYYIEKYTGAVSEEEFKAAVAEYIDTTQTEFLHKNALPYDAFIEQITNY